jgi:hypothetical protein
VAYLRAALLAFLAAIGLGVVSGAWSLLREAVAALRPEDKAVILSRNISEAMNCAAFYATILIPLGLGIAYYRRRMRRRE